MTLETTGDVQSTADAIYDAVTMDAETKKSNHDKLWKVSPIVVGYNLACHQELNLMLLYSTSRPTRPRSGEPTLYPSVSLYPIPAYNATPAQPAFETHSQTYPRRPSFRPRTWWP